MESYTINDNLIIEAWYFETRHNWGHKARAVYNSREVAEVKIVYSNRTWEAYKYQSVMQKLIDVLDEVKTIPLKDRREASLFIKHGDDRDLKNLRMIGAIASLGNMMEKGGNAFKKRILGTIDGLDIDAIDGLDEKTKQQRLDGVINIMMQ